MYKMGFNKGFGGERWETAKTLRDYYNKETGKNLGVEEFYKNDNPMMDKVYKYEVTIELDYNNSEKGYSFFIPQETFTFYSLNPNSSDFFEEQVKIWKLYQKWM